MPAWDHAQYLKFEDARTRPARELLQRVPLTAAELVIDLGCGPGNSTELLRERWPEAELVGVDSSADMLLRARQVLPDVRFEQADVRDYRAARACDLLFANAVLQWLPDHAQLETLQCSRRVFCMKSTSAGNQACWLGSAYKFRPYAGSIWAGVAITDSALNTKRKFTTYSGVVS